MFINVSGYFSDESTTAVLDDRVQTVRQRSGKEFLPQCLKKAVKFPTKIMVWGAIPVFPSLSGEYFFPFPISFLWHYQFELICLISWHLFLLEVTMLE